MKNANPFTSPSTNQLSAIGPQNNGVLPKVLIGLSAVAMLILLVIAGMLFAQAFRLGGESSNLPPRLQGSAGAQSMVVASWVGGTTALFGIVLNISAILLLRRGKISIPATLMVLSIVSMVAVAVLFKPS